MPGSAGQLGAETGPDRQPALAVEDQAAHAAAELTGQPAGCPLAEPVQVAADLIRPGGRFPAERHRAARLAVGAAGHHGGPVRHGQLQQPLLDLPQVPPDDGADPA
jgi:hypothetical protein